MMNKSQHSFGAYRYFIVPSEQISFFDTIKEKRQHAVENFFSVLEKEKKRNWEIGGKKHLLVFNRKISEDILVCKFSMETKKTIFKEGKSDIEDITEINYPFIYVIIDIKRQIILIELKTSVFSSLNSAKEKLKECFEQGFELHGFEVLFDEITDSNTFWTFVNNSLGVFEVSLILNSPNLFGGFNNTNDLLKNISKTYNNSQTTIKISSKSAKLKNIKNDNKSLSDAIEYTSGGGGEWAVTVLSKEVTRKTYKSRHNIKKVSIRKLDVKENKKKSEKDIIQALNSVENVLLEQNHHNEK
jgi:hypothetical protein